MKIRYIQPEVKETGILTEAMLDYISVDPSQEGNQEEAESQEYQWDETAEWHSHLQTNVWE